MKASDITRITGPAMAVVAVVAIIAVTACRPGVPPGLPPALTPAPPQTPPEHDVTTVGALADKGQTVFATICANCHGSRGQGIIGPAIIGPKAALQKFRTARGLYNFISIAMPFNAPGSLTPEQYLQVMSYLLVQNKLVPPEAEVGSGNLEALELKAAGPD